LQLNDKLRKVRVLIKNGFDIILDHNGGIDTDWTTPGNWDPDGYADSDDLTVLSGAPTASTTIYADDGGTITLNGSAAVASFTPCRSVSWVRNRSAIRVRSSARFW